MSIYEEHYRSIVRRGLITDKTKPLDFITKILEESQEVIDACDYTLKSGLTMSYTLAHELTDLAMVCANFLQHYGIDFEESVKKNLIIQKNRANLNSF